MAPARIKALHHRIHGKGILVQTALMPFEVIDQRSQVTDYMVIQFFRVADDILFLRDISIAVLAGR